MYDVNEVLTHPQLEARGFWQWIERAVVGVQPHPVAPYRSGAEPYGIDAPAPTMGEHGRLVLGELLGLGDVELDELERIGVIGTLPRLSRDSEPVSTTSPFSSFLLGGQVFARRLRRSSDSWGPFRSAPPRTALRALH